MSIIITVKNVDLTIGKTEILKPIYYLSPIFRCKNFMILAIQLRMR